jgi:hypothetical protein
MRLIPVWGSNEKVVSTTASWPSNAADNESTELKSTTLTATLDGNDLLLDRLRTVTLKPDSIRALTASEPRFPLAYSKLVSTYKEYMSGKPTPATTTFLIIGAIMLLGSGPSKKDVELPGWILSSR